MTEPMEFLCEYLIEKRVPKLVPSDYYWHNARVLENLSDKLYQSLSKEQWELFESYLDALLEQESQTQQALFLATLDLVREFVRPSLSW